MVVKVWGSGVAGGSVEEAMMGGWTELFDFKLGWSLPPSRQRGFVSSLQWDEDWGRTYQNAEIFDRR